MAYPSKNGDPELSKKTSVGKIKNLKYKTEKHDQDNILKSFKIDIEYYKNKYKNSKKKKVLIFITKILVGSASTISTSTMGLINPIVGIIISSSTALLTSIAIIITDEFISNLKIRHIKIRDWINDITLLNEKTLKQSMIYEENRSNRS